MLLLVVAIVALTAFFAVKYFNFVSYWRRKGIKYEPAKTLLGNIHNNVMQKESMADILQGMYKKFPDEPYFGITTFMRPTLVVKDPALIKELAVKNLDTFMVHKLFNSGDKSHVFSKNLFAASGEIWRSTRPALSPAFSGSKIKAMYNLVNNCSYQWFRSFEKNNDKLMTIDLKHDILTRFTIDVISTCIFGLESNSFANKTNEFYERALDAGDFGGKKIFALFGYCLPEFLVKMFNLRVVSQNNQDFFATVVKETIRIRKENNITRPDVINLLMEGRKGNLKHDADNSLGDTGFATVEESFMGKGNVEMSDEEIVGHSLLFLIAGSDTTACGLTFLFYELALNKDVQDRLAEEIREFMVEHNGKIPYEELPKMKYMDMVCSESLRKWPPLPVTDRCTVRPYTIETGDNKPLHLETGSVVWFPMFAIHRDPKYFENPEKFDPERFSDENRAKINKDAYLPFGIGPKACIGSRLAMLMFKSIVVHVLYNFEIVPVEKTPIPLELSKKHIFLNPESTVWLGLQRRA